LNTSITDSGFRRDESDASKTLYKYQEESLKSLFNNNGFNGLDAILAYLDAHPEVFPLFSESENYTQRKISFIPSTATFNSVFYINNSRLVFIRLMRFIKEAEDSDIQSVLGAALYKKLKENQLAVDPDPKLIALVPYIQKPLAYLAVSKAVFELGMDVTDKGLFFEAQASTMQNSTVRTPLSDSQSFTLARKTSETATAYLELLKEFLASNRDDYPDYQGSTGSVYARDNQCKSTFWA